MELWSFSEFITSSPVHAFRFLESLDTLLLGERNTKFWSNCRQTRSNSVPSASPVAREEAVFAARKGLGKLPWMSGTKIVPRSNNPGR